MRQGLWEELADGLFEQYKRDREGKVNPLVRELYKEYFRGIDTSQSHHYKYLMEKSNAT